MNEDDIKDATEKELIANIAKEPELYRCHRDALRFIEFQEANKAQIEARHILLNIPMSVAAAVLFTARELQVERDRLSSPKEVLVGLGSTRVHGGGSANISVQTLQPMVPERLEVPPEVAQNFLLTDLKVGKNSQLLSFGAIPLSVFLDRRHQYLKLAMDVATPDDFIILSVANQHPQARNFQGVIVGLAPEYQP